MVDRGSKRHQEDAAALAGRATPNVDNVPGVLKAFVIAGGVALLIGVILLAALIMLRAGGGSERASTPPAEPVDLALPAGARVGQVVVDGRRLVLLAEGPDGGQYLAVVDALSGERLSLIRIIPAR